MQSGNGDGCVVSRRPPERSSSMGGTVPGGICGNFVSDTRSTAPSRSTSACVRRMASETEGRWRPADRTGWRTSVAAGHPRGAGSPPHAAARRSRGRSRRGARHAGSQVPGNGRKGPRCAGPGRSHVVREGSDDLQLARPMCRSRSLGQLGPAHRQRRGDGAPMSRGFLCSGRSPAAAAPVASGQTPACAGGGGTPPRSAHAGLDHGRSSGQGKATPASRSTSTLA